MTLKDLILKYEFDTIVPVKNNLYAFKEAFNTLRRMTPGDAGGEQIAVGNIGNLVETLAITAYFKQVFTIHQEISLRRLLHSSYGYTLVNKECLPKCPRLH